MTRCAGSRALGDGRQGDDADGDVDVESPAPVHVVGDESAEQGAADERHRQHDAHHRLDAAALLWGHQHTDDRERPDHQAARAETLDGPEGDELPHALRQAAQHRPDQEEQHGVGVGALVAVEVAELAPEGGGGGHGEQVRRHRPGEVVQAAEIAHDRGQCGAGDLSVERRQEDAEHQSEDAEPG